MTDRQVLLSKVAHVAQARVDAIVEAKRRTRREEERHEEAMMQIRSFRANANRALANVLEEASKAKVPQKELCHATGLSRQFLHQLRQSAKRGQYDA